MLHGITSAIHKAHHGGPQMKKIVYLFFAIAVICGTAMTLAMKAGNTLWSLIFGLLFAGFLCVLLWFSRCPHCKRIVKFTMFHKGSMYCVHCGKKIELE